MPADPKVKPIFRAPTKQSKLIDIFASSPGLSPIQDLTRQLPHREMDLLADLARELLRCMEKVNLSSLFFHLEMTILPVPCFHGEKSSVCRPQQTGGPG